MTRIIICTLVAALGIALVANNHNLAMEQCQQTHSYSTCAYQLR